MATETLRPEAAGDVTDLAPNTGTNWGAVDEAVSDDDATYVVSPGDAELHYDLYNLPATAIPAGSTINSVNVYINARSTNATYKAKFKTILKKSGGAEQRGAQNSPGTSYTLYNDSFAGVTQGDLNALQIGVQIQSGLFILHEIEFYYPGRCTQVYVVIDYTLAAGYNKQGQFFKFFR